MASFPSLPISPRMEDVVVPSNTATYERGALWFDDGNMILVAGRTAFRLYQGILSLNSEVFRDMLVAPQLAIAERSDGCPVVHVSDSEEVLLRVLLILFDSKNAPGFKPSLPFATVSAMLQTGTQYQINHLRVDAIARLQGLLPERLDDFHNFFSASSPKFDHGHVFPDDSVQIMGEEPIAVIQLARTYSVPSFLPPAFYLAVHLGYEFR